MGLHDLIEGVDPAERDRRSALGDRVEEVLKDRCRKVGGIAGIGGQPDAVGQPVHRIELGDSPIVRPHAGEADRAQPAMIVAGRA